MSFSDTPDPSGGPDQAGTRDGAVPPRGATGVESRHDGLRRRGPLTWVVAAAAVLLIAGGALFALVSRGTGPADAPVAGAPGSPTAMATTTELGAPADRGSARCLPPSAATLRGQDVAVDAVVTDVARGTVTLTPSRFYAGRETDRVVVRTGRADLGELVGAADLRPGERYLLSARQGQVSVCGLTGPWSPELADLYAEAFAG